MRKLLIGMAIAPALVLAAAAPAVSAGQGTAEDGACAQLISSIESLKEMLGQESKARTAERESQRMQLVVTLLGLRYRNIEGVESRLRTLDSEEDDVRGGMARLGAQLDALDELARTSPETPPDPQRRGQKASFEADLKALEERAKGIRERRATYQGQLALERRDIEKLEAVVRDWIEKAP